MSDPLRLFRECLLDRGGGGGGGGGPFACLQHGDSWHNNFLFRRARADAVRSAAVDWQVAFHGNAVADLCYLLYSTSTGLFRRKYADELMTAYFARCVGGGGNTEFRISGEKNNYFPRLLEVVRALGLDHHQFNPTFREFDEEFQQV